MIMKELNIIKKFIYRDDGLFNINDDLIAMHSLNTATTKLESIDFPISG